MTRLFKLSLSLAWIAFALAILFSHQKGQIYSALPVGMILTMLMLSVPLFLAPQQLSLPKYVLSVIPFAVGYRAYIFQFPASMVGLDPDGVAITVGSIIRTGTLQPLQGAYFYNSAPGFHVFTGSFSLISGLPSNKGFIILSIAVGILAPLFAALLAVAVFGHTEKKIIGIAALLGAIGSMSLVFSYSVNAQTIGVVLMYGGLYLMVTYLGTRTEARLALILLVFGTMTFSHKLVVFLIVAILGSLAVYELLLSASSYHDRGSEISPWQISSVFLLLIATIILYAQWALVTTYILSAISKIVILFTGPAKIPTASTTPAAVEPVYRGTLDLFRRYIHGMVLLPVAGVGWLFLFFRRDQIPQMRFVLAGSAAAVLLTGASIISSGTTSPARILSYTELLLFVLAAAAVALVGRRDGILGKGLSVLFLIILVTSQLVTPLAAPDYPHLRPTVYLNAQEVDGKVHVREYVDGDVYTDIYYAKETIPSAFDEGKQSNEGFVATNGGYATGNLTEKDYPWILHRYNERVMKTKVGLWRLTWNPKGSLDSSYSKVYNNGDVSLYAMFPFEVFTSEASAANLLQQVRWREGLQCPRCRSESMIKYGSYRKNQRYRCKECDRSFNDKTDTIFAHAKIALRKLLFVIYVFLRFNTSIRQIAAELDVSYRSLRRRVETFARTLDAPSLQLAGPVEIDEVYVSAGLKGRERDAGSRSRGLSTRGRG